MKRLTTLTAIALTVGLGLVACGDDEPTAHSGGGTATTENGMMDGGHMGDGHGESSGVADGARRIKVTATSFEFDSSEITVKTGEEIGIELTSTDILHDFTIDEFDAHVAADRGETNEGGFTAGEPGRYTYYCTVAGHREAGMEGTLIVE